MQNFRSGFSLSGALAAIAISGVLFTVAGKYILQSIKSQKFVANKSDEEQVLRDVMVSISDEEVCANSLFLGNSSLNKPRLSATDENLNSWKYKIQASLEIGLGRLNPEANEEDRKVRTTSLVLHDLYFTNIRPFKLPTDYRALMNIRFSQTGGNGPEQLRERSIPLILKTEPNEDILPEDTTDRKIVSCYSSSGEMKLDALCKDLGGRWLAGVYMPAEKCNMTNDISLDMIEWPDEHLPIGDEKQIPGDGCVSELGERVSECRYQSAGSIKTYNCTSRCGNRKGYRCAYDRPSKKWGIWYYNSSGVKTTKSRDCDRGVVVSTRSPAYARIDWEDDLKSAFNPTAESDDRYTLAERNDRIASVSRCQYVPDGDWWTQCSNNTNEKGAIEGAVGTCIWVDNVRLTGDSTPGRVNNYCTSIGGCPLGSNMTVANYTGWIRVTSTRNYLTSNPNSHIQEARGYPCFVVEVNTASAEEKNFTIPSSLDNNTAPTNAEFADPSSIKECYASDSQDPAEPSHTGDRRPAFQCNNPDTIDDRSDLGVGTCWYVSNLRLNRNDYSVWNGWVYFNAAAGSNGGARGNFQAGTGIIDGPGAGSASQSFATPCRAGVRKQAP